MSIWNKVLLVLVFFCVIGVFYFGAQSLKNRAAAQNKLKQVNKSISDEKQKKDQLLYGSSPNDGGYEKLNAQVNTLRKRHDARAWFLCKPVAAPEVSDIAVTLRLQLSQDKANEANGGNGEVASTETPAKHVAVDPSQRIPLKTMVYLFDRRGLQEGGAFLGEFSIESADAQGVTLKNTLLMTSAEVGRINDSYAASADWVVYTILQNAARNITAEQTPSTDAGADAVAPAENSDPQNAVVVLAQDYSALHLKRTELLKDIDMLNRQIESLNKADTKGREMGVFYQKEIDETKAMLAEDLRQQTEVRTVSDALKNEITQMTAQIATLKALNKKILSDLTLAQIKSAEEITRRNTETAASL